MPSVILRPNELPDIDRGNGVRSVHLVTSALGETPFTNGTTTFDEGASLPLHSHDCVESVLVLEGLAVFEDEHGTQELNPGDITLVPANTVHRFINAGTSHLRIFWIYGSANPTRTIAATGESRSLNEEGT